MSRERTQCDARAYALTLTPRGREALMRHAAMAKRAEHAALSHLTAKQQEELIRLLTVLAQMSTHETLRQGA
jgi:DNA-binding MarR family transcriptional regulator